MIGTSVDRYEILEELGHGGMSVVYRGMDSSLEREVAVKVLHNHLAKKFENRQRFHREAKAIARLRHPNILEVYDFSSEDEERSYIVMEYVAGYNLRQFITEAGTPPPECAALIVVEICHALEHAHDHGIIHRDLKPENIMVSATGDLKLMDFGIAHVIDAETMTATGSLMGSPAHMAPELIDGKPVDVRADIFALGTVLYWLSTGRLPFEGANAPQVLKRVLEGDFDEPEVVEPKVGKPLGDIIRRCLAHDPDDRFTTVSGVRRELETVLAAMGMSDVDRELKQYFNAPEAYAKAFDDTVVERLMTLARRAERERDVPVAIGYFNRILAYEPDNQDVQRMLDTLCRRRRLREFAPVALVGCAVIAAAVGLFFTMGDDADPPSTTTATNGAAVAPVEFDEVSDQIEESAAVAEQTVVRATERGEAFGAWVVSRATELAEPAKDTEPVAFMNKVQPKLAPAPELAVPTPVAEDPDAGVEVPPERFKYRFNVSPAAATLVIDGRQVEAFRASTMGVMLEEGNHDISATSRGAKSWRGRLSVTGPQERPLDVVLEWEDGRVQVLSNTKAVVWLGESRKMTPIGANGRNATFTIPFGPADSTDPQKEIRLRVASQDRMEDSKTYPVLVKPGQVTPVTVNFDPVP